MYLDFLVYISLSLCYYFACVKTRSFNFIPTSYSKKTTHVPKVLLNTCLLEPKRGPCRGNFRMYYFDPSTQNCSTFRWGGCQGNGNRYDTEKECMSQCLSTPDTRTGRPPWCSLSFDYGYCFGAYKRWYYDSIYQTCKSRIYSGCGGNKNNFYNKHQCQNICIYGNMTSLRSSSKKHDESKVLIIDPTNSTRKLLTKSITKKS